MNKGNVALKTMLYIFIRGRMLYLVKVKNVKIFV